MTRNRVPPDLATFNAVLDAYARNGRVEEAEAVRFSDPGEHRPWSRVRVPPTINFKYLEGSAKSFLSGLLEHRFR